MSLLLTSSLAASPVTSSQLAARMLRRGNAGAAWLLGASLRRRGRGASRGVWVWERNRCLWISFFYIFLSSVFQKYMVKKICKTIHLVPWGRWQGPTVVPHGVRGVAPATAVSHGGRGTVCFQNSFF
jgi:hypothetical protein